MAAVHPARLPWSLLLAGLLAWTAGLYLSLWLRGVRGIEFLVRQTEQVGQVVRRPGFEAVAALGVVVLALVCVACGHLVLRRASAPGAVPWPGVVGAVWWLLGFGLLAAQGPAMLHVLADVIVGATL